MPYTASTRLINYDLFALDHQLHVLQHPEPESKDGAGHLGDRQLPADRHACHGLRSVCQGQVHNLIQYSRYNTQFVKGRYIT